MKRLLFLVLVVLLLAGCNMPTGYDEYGRVFCENRSFDDTEYKVISKNIDEKEFVIDCDYNDADKLEEIKLMKEIKEDRFELKITGD